MKSPQSLSYSPRRESRQSGSLRKKQDSDSRTKSAIPALLFSILAAANLFLFCSMRSKQQQLSKLGEERQRAQVLLEKAQQHQRTGMSAASMLNELEGWRHVPPLPVQLLEWFSALPHELTLKSFHLERPHLLRPLPENGHRSRFFKQSLALAGYAAIKLEDSGEGNGKYELPRFFDQTNAKFESRFVIDPTAPEMGETLEKEEALPDARPKQWLLRTSLNQEPVWVPSCPRKAAFRE